MTITEYLESQIGEHIQVSTSKHGVTTVIKGMVDKYEVLPWFIESLTTKERWPAFRLRLKPDDGGRALWTCSFPFKGADAEVDQ